MNESKDRCSLPQAGETKPGAWPWVWTGLGLAAIVLAYVGGQGQGFLPETMTGVLGIVGLALLFGGLISRGGQGGG
ncbi:MAG: hypothetical protein M1370_11550 [Bacteroidetes bacterium]|nr:hypothetical protein [Bacteroidota bacterium]MCL5027045.1 hypothetical protein [Chloroflexota bacterium]